MAAALAGAGLLVAACGGGSHPAGGGDPASQNQAVAAAAYVRCMHSHGLPGLHVTNAPSNPNPNDPNIAMILHGLAIEGANGNSSQFQSAMRSCGHLLGITPPNGTETHQQFLMALKIARCMRARGYPNWPDPGRTSPAYTSHRTST